MKQYFIWDSLVKGTPSSHDMGIINMGELEDNRWFGIKNTNWCNPIVEIKQQRMVSDCFYCGSMLIVNQKTKDILTQFQPSDIEFMPVDVRHNDNLLRYFCMNPLAEHDLIIPEQSSFEVDRFGEKHNFRKATFNHHLDLSDHVFYLSNVSSFKIIVTQKVLTAVKAAKITGVKFIPDNKWNDTII